MRIAIPKASALFALMFGVLALLPLALEAQPRRPGGPPLSLRAARAAEFTAEEGTWISLDVSPDGRMIVFDLLGDLYTMPVTGGKASPLLTGMAYEAQPRFSPDGESVVFVSDRSGGDNIWTMRLDRTDTSQISRGNRNLFLSPEWTPDGDHVVVSRSGGLGGPASLFLYHVERGSPVRMGPSPSGPGSPFAPPAAKMIGAAVDPSGRYVWYASGSGDWQYNARLPRYQIRKLDRKTGIATTMTNRYGSGMRPAISPDGRTLAYASRYNAETGLRARDLESGDERWLAYPIQRDEQESRAPLDLLPGYSFTPDGEAIVISYGGKIWRVPLDGGEHVEIPFEVEVNVGIGPKVAFDYAIDTAAMVAARQIRAPAVSPDGSRLAFTAFDRLWTKELPDGEARRVTQGASSELHPQWSPDGEWIAYATWDDAEGGHIMKARPDGGDPVQLTRTPAIYYNVAWSPEGDRIVATRGPARQLIEASGLFFGPAGAEFVWVPAGGEAPAPAPATLISPAGLRDVAHFSALEPDRIYAYSPIEGLVSFRWDGTDVRPHLAVRAPQGLQGVLSPHPGEPEYLPRRPFPWKLSPDPTREPAEAAGPSPASLIMLSPSGDQAFALFGRDLYVVDIGANRHEPQAVTLVALGASPVPIRKVSEVGAEFPSWAADGSKLHWALGPAFFSYDLDFVEAEEEREEQEARGRALIRARAIAISDTLKKLRAEADSIEQEDESASDSLSAEITRLAADSVQIEADSLVARADSIRRAADRAAEKARKVREGNKEILEDSTESYEASERMLEVKLPRDRPRGLAALVGGRLLTMTSRPGDTLGAPGVIENGVVVIRDNKIIEVGKADSVVVPDSARVIDVSGKTLLPGFIDTHYHAQWLVPVVHTEEVWQYLATLAYGVTTTRDPQTATTDILSYADRVETGMMTGPRIYSTGPGIFSFENISSQGHAKSVLSRYSKYFDTKTIKMYMSGNRQQRQWIIQAARELRLMPTTEGGLDFKIDVTHAIDGYPGVEHNLPIAPIYSDVVELFKESETTNSPTLLVSYGGPFGENYFYATEEVHDDPKLNVFVPAENIDQRARRRGPGAGGSPGQVGWFLEEEHVFPRHAEFVKKLLEEGGRMGVGSHGQIQGVGFHWEMWAMGSGGASNHDILRAATILGAEAIGFGKELGSLESGKFADIVVLNSNPLDDLRNTVDLLYVMKDGRLYDAMTLDELYPTERSIIRERPPRAPAAAAAAGIRGSRDF